MAYRSLLMKVVVQAVQLLLASDNLGSLISAGSTLCRCLRGLLLCGSHGRVDRDANVRGTVSNDEVLSCGDEADEVSSPGLSIYTTYLPEAEYMYVVTEVDQQTALIDSG